MQLLAERAASRNKQPLPELSSKPGLQIPVNSLIGPSYQLSVPADNSLPSATEENADTIAPAADTGGSSLRGAKQQQQIQVNISSGQQMQMPGEWTDAG